MTEEISRLRNYVTAKIAPAHDFLNLRLLKGSHSRFGQATGTQHQATGSRHRAVRDKVVQATEILKRHSPDTPYRYGNVGCGHEATINLNDYLNDTFPGDTFHWVGLDVSPKTIAAAADMLQQRKRQAGQKASAINIRFKVFDMFTLLDGFDPHHIPLYPWHLAVIEGVLHNYTDSECVLFIDAVKKCLRKDGLLVIADFAHEGYTFFQRFLLTHLVIPLQMYPRNKVGFGLKFNYRKYRDLVSIITTARLEILDYTLAHPNHVFLLRNK